MLPWKTQCGSTQLRLKKEKIDERSKEEEGLEEGRERGMQSAGYALCLVGLKGRGKDSIYPWQQGRQRPQHQPRLTPGVSSRGPPLPTHTEHTAGPAGQGAGVPGWLHATLQGQAWFP